MGEYISQRKQDAIVRWGQRQEEKRQKAEKKLRELIAKGKIKTQEQFLALAEKAYPTTESTHKYAKYFPIKKFNKEEISFIDGDQTKKYLVFSSPTNGGYINRTRLVCCVDQNGQIEFDANYPMSFEKSADSSPTTHTTLRNIEEKHSIKKATGRRSSYYYSSSEQGAHKLHLWEYDEKTHTYTKNPEPTSFEKIVSKERNSDVIHTSQDGMVCDTYDPEKNQIIKTTLEPDGVIYAHECETYTHMDTTIAWNDPRNPEDAYGVVRIRHGIRGVSTVHFIDPSNPSSSKDKTYMLSDKVCLFSVEKKDGSSQLYVISLNFNTGMDYGKITEIYPCDNLTSAIKTANSIDNRIKITESAQLDIQGNETEHNPVNLIGITSPIYTNGVTLCDLSPQDGVCIGGGAAQLHDGSVEEVAERIQGNTHEGELSYSKGGPGVDPNSFLGRLLQQ